MHTHIVTRLLALILSLRHVAQIHISLNSCDRSQRQNSVAATTIFTCHTRRFVAATSRCNLLQQFVASCVSALKRLGVCLLPSPLSNLPVPIYKPGWREALWEWSGLPKNTITDPWPGFELATVDPQSRAITLRLLCLLPYKYLCVKVWSLKFIIHKYIAVKKLNCVFTHIMKIVKLHWLTKGIV